MEFTGHEPPGKSPLENLAARAFDAELERLHSIASCSTVTGERLTRPATGGVRGGPIATVRLFSDSAHPIVLSLPAGCVAISPYAGMPWSQMRPDNQP